MIPFIEKNQKLHIIGISGAEGSSVASFLLKQGYTNIVGHDHVPESGFRESFFRFHDWMTEEEKEASFAKLRGSGITFHFEDTYLADIGEEDIIFVPQSWFRYGFNEPLRKYFQEDLRVKPEFQDRIWSMTKLYLTLFPGRVVGVTGSNGKSTTTAMIAAILKEHLEATKTGKLYWGGNDRKNPQPLDEIESATEQDILLLEMSNRQLSLGLGKSPNVAVITNVVPNHLDDHGTFEAYVRVKEEIVRYQDEGDTAVLNWNNVPSREAKNVTVGNVLFFDINHDGKPVPEGFVGTRREGNELVSYPADGWRTVMASTEDVTVPGEHNVENALAAIAAVSPFSVGAEAVRSALRGFGGLDHRLELVAEKVGVKYVNDSSGCSPLNIVMAVKALPGNLILIMGGHRKNPTPGEFLPVAEAVKDARIKHAFVIGSIQETLEKELLEGGVENDKITCCTNLEDAFSKAKEMAQSGNTIALTPGCESFGEFRDYRERGEKFRKLSLSLHNR